MALAKTACLGTPAALATTVEPAVALPPRALLQDLPAAALTPLRSALALGDLEGVRLALQRLGEVLPSAQPLIDRCHALLENFELEPIRDLLEELPGNR